MLQEGGQAGVTAPSEARSNASAFECDSPELASLQGGLRPYQVDVIARVNAAIAAGKRRVLLVAPTAAGKTVIAAAIISDVIARKQRALFLAHRRELIMQASRKMHAEGLDHGILLPDHPMRLHERLQIGSVPTLHARAIRTCSIELPAADLVIIDEAHHTPARTYRRIIEGYPDAVIIGLTATPCRGDGRGLGSAFDVIVECPSVAELIKLEWLVPTRVYAPCVPDLKGVSVQRGDYAKSELEQRMNKAKLVGDIVSHWLILGENRPTVVFASGVAHSLHIRDEFRNFDVLAEHIDGTTPTEERDRILARLAAGEVQIVCNAMVLTEGWDQPSVSCIVLARPTKSLGLYRQMVGRVLRTSPGKKDALVLDHAGATFTHGFVEDPIEWTLQDDRRAQNRLHSTRGQGSGAPPKLTACPECTAIMLAGKPCGACGWRPPRKPAAVAVADGELGHVQRDRSVRTNEYSQREKDRWHRMLLGYARERNYKPGWAAHKYFEKFKEWPPRSLPEPEPPNSVVRAWARSRVIAYRKAMGASKP